MLQFFIGDSSRPLKIRINKHKDYTKKKINKFSNMHSTMGTEYNFRALSFYTKSKIILGVKSNVLNEDICVATISVVICRLWLPITKEKISKNNTRLPLYVRIDREIFRSFPM